MYRASNTEIQPERAHRVCSVSFKRNVFHGYGLTLISSSQIIKYYCNLCNAERGSESKMSTHIATHVAEHEEVGRAPRKLFMTRVELPPGTEYREPAFAPPPEDATGNEQ